jgi:Site-specific recombinase XerD
MARHEIDKITVRRGLAAQREPYWGAPIETGLFVGFRRLVHGGSWIARLRVDGGSQRYQSLGNEGGMDYDAAKKSARIWAASLRAGVDNSSVRTVSDACRKYVQDRRIEAGDANANDANGRFERTVYGKPIGSVKLDQLRSDHIKNWRSSLDMKPASVNRTMSTLKAVLNFAVASRFVDAGRAIEWNSIKLAKVTGTRDLYLDRAHRQLLLEKLEPWAHDFVRALSLLPIRPGALAKLQVQDFDRKAKLLTIPIDKAGAGRSIGLPDSFVHFFAKNAADKMASAPLLSYEDGTFWNKERWKQPIKRAARSAGLSKDVCAYTFRHSVITDLVVGGLDLLTVAKLAGTSVLMIDKYYGKLQQQRAVDALEAFTA